MEHRWGRRVVVDIPIHITAANISVMKSAQLANLSITGALIETGFRPRLLSRIEIVIESSLGHGDAVSIEAYVARHCRGGIGVEWCDSASLGLIKLLRDVTAPSGTRPQRPAPVRSSGAPPTVRVRRRREN